MIETSKRWPLHEQSAQQALGNNCAQVGTGAHEGDMRGERKRLHRRPPNIPFPSRVFLARVRSFLRPFIAQRLRFRLLHEQRCNFAAFFSSIILSGSYRRFNYIPVFILCMCDQTKPVGEINQVNKILALFCAAHQCSLKLVVVFAKCQREKKNLPTSPVSVPMFIKPFQLLRRECPLQTPLVPTFLPLFALKSLLFFCLDIFEH